MNPGIWINRLAYHCCPGLEAGVTKPSAFPVELAVHLIPCFSSVDWMENTKCKVDTIEISGKSEAPK